MSSKENNIEKFRGSLSKEDGGFTTFINSSLRSITDGFAAGVYVYLLCLPPDWELHPAQLAAHYHCNKAKIYNALLLLRKLGLLTREDIREKGKFVKFHYIVHLRTKSEKSQLNTGVSPVLKKPELVKPELINQDAYKRKNIQKKESKKTTTTLARDNPKKSSSSDFVISEKVDKELLAERKKHLQADDLDRTDEEFLRQCSHHLDNGDKQKYNLTRRLKGLKTIIQSGFFEKPAGYDEKKVVKSIFTPEENVLIQTYEHALKMEKLGMKIQDFIPEPQELKRAMQLAEKAKANKTSLSKIFGSMMGFNSV